MSGLYLYLFLPLTVLVDRIGGKCKHFFFLILFEISVERFLDCTGGSRFVKWKPLQTRKVLFYVSVIRDKEIYVL